VLGFRPVLARAQFRLSGLTPSPCCSGLSPFRDLGKRLSPPADAQLTPVSSVIGPSWMRMVRSVRVAMALSWVISTMV
ncbi:MAG: hypothetical protein V3T72_05075, partial [Thermoanaerobaculia bacterium]